MAGKLHKDYEKYAIGGGQVLAPGDRRVRAYAEGYQAQVAGKPQDANPFGTVLVDNFDNQARCWDQGWRDAGAGLPPTHVGGPTGIPTPEPEPDPEPDPELRRSRRSRR
jgi:ribosome modulation factor